jgi:Pyridoxal-dependent decarboxylase, C-terminal sheet domain
LVTQETDAYNDGLDLYEEDFATAADLLGVPDERQMKSIVHSVEGMSKAIATGEIEGILLAAAGEAAVNGMVLQAVADSAPLQDDYSYYLNDGVYGAFNNLMFDHATVRPCVLRLSGNSTNTAVAAALSRDHEKVTDNEKDKDKDQSLYASTVFGPTCDSIDVIARSVLLPKLKIGDWLYFQKSKLRMFMAKLPRL